MLGLLQSIPFSKRTMNEWDKLSSDCVHSSSIAMFMDRIDNYLVRAIHLDSYMWILDKPTASLSAAI